MASPAKQLKTDNLGNQYGRVKPKAKPKKKTIVKKFNKVPAPQPDSPAKPKPSKTTIDYNAKGKKLKDVKVPKVPVIAKKKKVKKTVSNKQARSNNKKTAAQLRAELRLAKTKNQGRKKTNKLNKKINKVNSKNPYYRGSRNND